jgi:hypothetical protein
MPGNVGNLFAAKKTHTNHLAWATARERAVTITEGG